MGRGLNPFHFRVEFQYKGDSESDYGFSLNPFHFRVEFQSES